MNTFAVVPLPEDIIGHIPARPDVMQIFLSSGTKRG